MTPKPRFSRAIESTEQRIIQVLMLIYTEWIVNRKGNEEHAEFIKLSGVMRNEYGLSKFKNFLQACAAVHLFSYTYAHRRSVQIIWSYRVANFDSTPLAELNSFASRIRVFMSEKIKNPKKEPHIGAPVTELHIEEEPKGFERMQGPAAMLPPLHIGKHAVEQGEPQIRSVTKNGFVTIEINLGELHISITTAK